MVGDHMGILGAVVTFLLFRDFAALSEEGGCLGCLGPAAAVGGGAENFFYPVTHNVGQIRRPSGRFRVGLWHISALACVLRHGTVQRGRYGAPGRWFVRSR
jgi:hypothetical protein